MNTKIEELDPRLADLLGELKSVPARDLQVAAREKNKFLAEAVSLSENRCHIWWATIFHQKEKLAMNLIVSTLAIVGLLFGGNATVAAAQDDLPTDALYQIKLISEDARLWFNTDPAAEVDMLMQQSQTRTEEMAALNSMGVIPPAALTTRTQDRINQALQVVSTLDETRVTDSLLQVRKHLQTQDHLLSQQQDGTCAECEQILEQTRDMLRTQLADVEAGLADPQGFIHRHRKQTGIATAQPTQVPVTEEPIETEIPFTPQSPIIGAEPLITETPMICQQTSCTPALDGSGQQNGNMGTPEPQKGKNNGESQQKHDNSQRNGSENRGKH
jgi:hypothetical protein